MLLEKEVIFKDDLETIFGKRTFDEELTPIEIAPETATQE